MTLTGWIDDIAETRKELEKKITHGYIDLTKEEIPDAEENPNYDFVGEPEFKPLRRVDTKRKPEDVPHVNETDEQRHWRHLRNKSNLGKDYWIHLPSIPAVRRVHVQPREQLWHPTEAETSCPFSLEELTGERYTLMTRVSDGLIADKNDTFTEPVASQLEDMNGEPWTGYTQFQLKPEHQGGEERYGPLASTQGLGSNIQPHELVRDEMPVTEEDVIEKEETVSGDADTAKLPMDNDERSSTSPQEADTKRAAEEDLAEEHPCETPTG